MIKAKFNWVVACTAAAVLFTACKKDKSADAAPPPPPNPPTTSLADKIKDTTLLFSRDIYLWYNQIPSTFNARAHSDPDAIMTALRQYSIEPGFSGPVDKWSFAAKQQEWDNVSSGIAGDFGLGVFFNDANDLRVKSVERASPAGKAGVRRGWQIVKINNNTNVSTGNIDFIVTSVFNSTNTTFTFKKPDGSTVDMSLTAASYQEHPVYFDSVYNTTAGKLGYLVFNSFLGDTTEIYNEFNRVFTKFAQAGVNELAIDLRYNGGGYVSVQEKLANYVVNSSANGNLMMKQQFNDKYAQFNESTNFSKLGSLNPTRIFFIVSPSTASASELLINNVKPYMNVLILGRDKTYGKPVGFFPIPVGDWYIFPVSFRTVNKNGEGSYFGGFPLDHKVADGLDKDWGSVQENSLASILKYLNVGSFRTQSSGATPVTAEPKVVAGNKTLDEHRFKGTVDTRRPY
jgi:C-terminal processing protease CtpA/Prc